MKRKMFQIDLDIQSGQGQQNQSTNMFISFLIPKFYCKVSMM